MKSRKTETEVSNLAELVEAMTGGITKVVKPGVVDGVDLTFERPPRSVESQQVQDDENLMRILQRIETRLIRVETRTTNVIRYMGLPARGPSSEQAGGGRVERVGNKLLITGWDVPVRDINFALSMGRETFREDVQLIINNHVWATLHIHPVHYVGYPEGDKE